MIPPIWLLGLGAVLAAQVPPPQAAAAESAALREGYEAICRRETDELTALAKRLEAAGRHDESQLVLKRIEPSPTTPGSERFVPLAEVVAARGNAGPNGLANIPAEMPAAAEVATIRGNSARGLLDLANQALGGKTKHYALADRCLRAVLERDPDQADARRLLGYVPQAGGWATPFAAGQIKAAKILHPIYGWVDRSWVPHLERGELPAPFAAGQKPSQAQWLRAADADTLRNTIDRGWRIETEHFLIQTDVPLSEAIAFGRKLESFHDLFFSLLADVIAEDLPLARRYRDKAGTLPRPAPHTVFYFGDKAEYVEYLSRREGPDIDKTLGIYLPPRSNQRRGQAYFYRDPGGQLDITATLYHEVSHQLLFESTRVGPSAYKKNAGNYWVFEGLGTYFETIAPLPDGALQVGGFVGPRIDVARIRLIDRGEHVPIGQLVRLAQSGFNDPGQVHLNYAEAMALAVYLMHGQDGRYREGFLDYVRDALHGRLRLDGSSALDERLGVSYQTLDDELLAALKARP
jgi:hypothetical protein